MEERAIRRVFLQTGRSREIEVILKPCSLKKDCGRTNGLESRVERRGKRSDREAEFVLGADFLRSGTHGLQATPDHQGSRHESNGQAQRNYGTHEDEGRLLHNSFSRDRAL